MKQQFGLVHIYFGNGKGKTSSAVGQVIRSLGYDASVFVARFLKTKEWISGEVLFLEKQKNCKIISSELADPFFYSGNRKVSEQEVGDAQKKIFQTVLSEMADGYDIVLLDEILNTVPNYLSEIDILKLLRNKPKKTELILTGRPCPERILEKGDYVTEMKEIRHPFQQNISARKGIDF